MIDVADLVLFVGVILVACGLYLEPTIPMISVTAGLGAIQVAVMLALRGDPDEGEDDQ